MPTVVKRIEPHRRLGLSSTPTLRIAQKASSTFIKGAPVYIDSTGYITSTPVDTLTSSHSAVQAAAAEILGFAQEAGANSASDTSLVGVTPALPGMLFKGQMMSTTDSSNSGALKTTTQTMIGGNYGLAKLSGDTNYGIDADLASSRDAVTVVEAIDAIGTSGGLMGFVVRAGWRQLDL